MICRVLATLGIVTSPAAGSQVLVVVPMRIIPKVRTRNKMVDGERV